MSVDADENPHSGTTIAMLDSNFPGFLSMPEIGSRRLVALIVEWLQCPVGPLHRSLRSRQRAEQAGRY